MGENDDSHLQIGQVAARTELSIRTVRHYEEVGLVTPSARSAGGFRLYTEHDVRRLMVIRRMKPLGFTLAEMKQLLDSLESLDNPGADGAERSEAAALLTGFQDKAAESVARLRRHLAYAEEFAELLATRGS